MTERESTHWEDCWQVHIDCAVGLVLELGSRVENLEDALSVLGYDPEDLTWVQEADGYERLQTTRWVRRQPPETGTTEA